MIRRKKDYTFLRMLALITQLGISMLTCIFLCMIIGKFLSERLQISWIFPAVSSVGNISGIPFLLYDDHAFYKVKICVQLAKIFHLHQWEKERRIR